MKTKTYEILSAFADAMGEVDLEQLPDDSLSDVLRAISSELTCRLADARPAIKPKCHHAAPFHLALSEEQAALYEKAREEIWDTCASLLTTLEYLRVRGYVSEYGVEVPASGTTGEAESCIEWARRSLTSLENTVERITDSLHEEDEAPPCRRRGSEPDPHGNGEPKEPRPPHSGPDVDKDEE